MARLSLALFAVAVLVVGLSAFAVAVCPEVAAFDENGIDVKGDWPETNGGITVSISCPLEDGLFGTVMRTCTDSTWGPVSGECSLNCVEDEDCELFGSIGARCVGLPKTCECTEGFSGRLCENEDYRTCTAANEDARCTTEFYPECVEGLCCESECVGVCVSCRTANFHSLCREVVDEDPRGDCGPFNCIGSGECYEECTNSKGCSGDRLCVGGSYCYDPDRSLSYALVITFSNLPAMPNRRALRNEIALLGGISVNDVFIVSISGSFGSNLNNVTFAIEEDSVAEATEAMDAVVAGLEADGGDSLGSWDVSSYSSNRAATVGDLEGEGTLEDDELVLVIVVPIATLLIVVAICLCAYCYLRKGKSSSDSSGRKGSRRGAGSSDGAGSAATASSQCQQSEASLLASAEAGSASASAAGGASAEYEYEYEVVTVSASVSGT